jgi:hypothetical protein
VLSEGRGFQFGNAKGSLSLGLRQEENAQWGTGSPSWGYEGETELESGAREASSPLWACTEWTVCCLKVCGSG